MPRNSEIKFSEYFSLPNPGLRSYFDNVRKGQPDEYRTTFARGSSVQQVLREWQPTLDSLSDVWPTLVEFENDLAKKVGPMSIMKPLSERMEDIDSYYSSIAKKRSELSDSAVKAVIAEFSRVRGLQLRSQDKTVAKMKLSTNSGSPYFTKRRRVVDKTIPCLLSFADMSQLLPTQEWNMCAVLGWRGQEGGPSKDDVKQRVVWMFPFALNIAELQFYQPFIEAVQRFNIVPSWVGMDAVDARITKMFDTKSPDDLVICTDFSKFDQHFNESLQNAARSIIEAILTPNSQSRQWIQGIYPIKYSIPLAYDFGKVRTGKHGMGSGSGGTNCDETLAHRALQYEAAQHHNQRLNPNSQCLGDDGVLTYPGCTVEDVVSSYTAHGLDMNPDKQYASKQDCVYLRRWHHVNYRIDGVCAGVYSTYRALGRLCEQERWYDPEEWGPKMVALRQLSIIENVKYHPLRDQFAEFCMKRDKYRLGIDIPGFLDNIDKIAKESIDNMPDFLGYTKTMMPNEGTGLSQWWIVRYLKSRA
jgi:hypothetical protein